MTRRQLRRPSDEFRALAAFSMSHPSRQSGAFLMARALMVVAILMAMLIIPVYLKREREDRELAVYKKEVAMSQGPAGGLAAPASGARADGAPAGPRPMGYGMTYVFAQDEKTPPDLARLACQGGADPLDQPYQGACNPYEGDTSCRTVLPVLCVRPTGESLPPGLAAGAWLGWTGGALGATAPVMGAVLESEAIASARCEKELGAGWRMAQAHDGVGGQSSGGLQGLRTASLTEQSRYWVRVSDRKANCWDTGG